LPPTNPPVPKDPALFRKTLWRFALAVGRRFTEDRCTRVASALSYTTLLALVPLTAVSLAVLSMFPAFQTWMTTVQQFIYSNFVPASGEMVSKYLQQFAAAASRLTAWGLVFLVVTALMLMSTIERAMNDIWHALQPRKRLQRFMAYWAILTLGPILIGLSLSMTSYLISLPLFARESPLGGVRILLLGLMPVVFEFLAFLLLYTVVPNRPVRLRHALVGSLFAAVLFEIAKRAFGFFVVYFSSYKLIYGAVAALPMFLVWIYLSWTVILLGAVVTVMLPEWRAPAPRRRPAAAKDGRTTS
jgi:membrane protein